MKSLFLFTIGPVKSFIENSRKGIDLYAGSSMLSEMMWEAVSWLSKTEGIKVLFPVDQKLNKEVPNIPNRLVAEFTDYTQDDLRTVAENLTVFVKTYFHQRCVDMLKVAGISVRGIQLAKNQWEDFLEIYWIFEDYTSLSYSEIYQKLLAGIHEVKGIRPFSQSSEVWGRKCMRFPDYNAIFVKKYRSESNDKIVYPRHTNPEYLYDITDNTYLEYTVKEKEALSSIALVKRIYGMQRKDIYSIRNMLLESRIPNEMFAEAQIKTLGSEMRTMVANAVYDLENENVLEEDEYTLEAIAVAKDLHEKIRRTNIKLNSYYAIVKFDGDNMGEAFKQLKTVEDQQGLSERICSFAYEVPDIISRYGGLPVFAGGEDFLGFLPLNSLFVCIGELREKFYELTQRSFSVGISIAHLMQPMREVLNHADIMETHAKALSDKNAFAISIIKRSGDIVIMPAIKLTAEEGVPQLNLMVELIGMTKDSRFSRSMLFNISDHLKCFLVDEVKPEDSLTKILLKNCIFHSASDNEQFNKEYLLEQLMLFYKHSKNMEEFMQIVDGIAFLSKEVV